MITADESGRLASALMGDAVWPPVRGISFIDPSLLPGSPLGSESPECALAGAADEARLDFAFVPGGAEWAGRAVGALASADVAALWVVDGVVGPTLQGLGVAEGLRAVARGDERLSRAMDAAAERAVACARAGLDAGARAIVVADDMAGAAGPLIAPEWLAAEAFPRLARIAAEARTAGVPAILHCDGDARVLFGLARGAGFSAVHGDFGGAGGVVLALEAARAAGIALLGGVPTSALDSVAHGARAGASVAELARGGGLLPADDGGLTTPEQAEALFAALAAAARA